MLLLAVVTMIANGIRTADDLLSVPAPRGQQVAITIAAAFVFAALVALSVCAWHGKPIAFAALVASGVLTMIVFGGDAWPQLSASQISTGLPPWLRRWTVGASHTAVVAPLVAAICSTRHLQRQTAVAATPALNPPAPRQAPT